ENCGHYTFSNPAWEQSSSTWGVHPHHDSDSSRIVDSDSSRIIDSDADLGSHWDSDSHTHGHSDSLADANPRYECQPHPDSEFLT
ncbi:MAG TPA: hypothetical protein VMV09_00905, partial [Candidatus Saccharimonadales bacterium]|nr:hypothetical protein [Candidatus Saccharimonadales bacterium]